MHWRIVGIVALVMGALALFVVRPAFPPRASAIDPAKPAVASIPATVSVSARPATVSESGGPSIAVSPIQGLKSTELHDAFADARRSGPHEAIDIMEPRGTAVHAVADGTIAKLFLSKAGGNTVYQFDNTKTYCFYYAHLDHYAYDLHEGQQVKADDIIAYVGSTGDASADAPHLHFSILKLAPEKKWWKGTALNPYPVLMQLLR